MPTAKGRDFKVSWTGSVQEALAEFRVLSDGTGKSR